MLQVNGFNVRDVETVARTMIVKKVRATIVWIRNNYKHNVTKTAIEEMRNWGKNLTLNKKVK